MKKNHLQITGILLVAVLLTGCETMKEIDQAMYEAASSVAPKDRITGLHTVNFTERSEQIKKGNESSEKLLAEYKAKGGKLDRAVDPKMYQRLQQIFKRVHSVSHFKDESWEVFLIDEGSFNAFVTGGTHVIVHRGLMQQCDDDEVAAVIGHEIGHVTANHVFERHTHGVVMMIGNSKSTKRDSYGAAYTHEGEREADKIGILYSSLAGYDPSANARIWEKMYRETGDIWDGRGKSHPVNSQRSSEAKEIAAKVKQYYTQGLINSSSSDLINSNTLWDNSGTGLKAGEGGGFFAILEASIDTAAKHASAKTEEQRQLNKNAFVESVRNAVYLEDISEVGRDTLRLRIKYTGYRTLQKISFICFIDESLQIKSGLNQAIYPNRSYYVYFQSPDLPKYTPLLSDPGIIISDAE
jgi:hypothetical protein